MKRRAAFTLIELLVVIGILSMLITMMLPNLQAAVEAARQLKCRGNLKAIGGAIKSYDVENNAYPATAGDDALAPSGSWFGPDGQESVATDEDQAAYALFNELGSKVMSPTASLFMLVRDGTLDPGAFTCPADSDAKEYNLPRGVSRNRMIDFQSLKNVSYSVSYLWNDSNLGNVAWEPPSPANFALMSDLSPVVLSSTSAIQSDTYEGNSWNHERKGQNVLYADIHAKWAKNNRAGSSQDNIFTRRDDNGVPTAIVGGGSGANPSSASDSVMCIYGQR